MVENLPKMGEEIATQGQKTQRVPNRTNPRKNTPRHILIKLMKIKGIILKDNIKSHVFPTVCVC